MEIIPAVIIKKTKKFESLNELLELYVDDLDRKLRKDEAMDFIF